MTEVMGNPIGMVMNADTLGAVRDFALHRIQAIDAMLKSPRCGPEQAATLRKHRNAMVARLRSAEAGSSKSSKAMSAYDAAMRRHSKR